MSITNIASVQFQRAGRITDFYYKNMALEVGDEVLVDAQKGEAVGRVCLLKFEFLSPSQQQSTELKKILRPVSSSLREDSHVTDDSAKQIAVDLVSDLGLKMEVIQCQFQGVNKKKLLIFFAASERVDFRDLVKQLAAEFRMRIELRQIGPRDQAKIVGGVGVCGREYCCSSFLRQFIPVSIKMAKNQNLALNPNQVSGGCGRLLCCLSYENDMYTELRRQLPKVGRTVTHKLSDRKGSVISVDVLNGKVVVRLEQDGDLSPSLRSSSSQIATYLVSDLDFDRRSQKRSQGKDMRQHKRSSDRSKRTASWGEDLDVKALLEFQEQLASSLELNSNPKH